MKMIGNWIGTSLGVLAIVALVSTTHAATIPVTGWIVHNDWTTGGTTVGGTPSNPTFTPGGGNNGNSTTLMAPFTDVTLADGDSIEAATTLTMNDRALTGTNSLRTQLRFALLDNTDNTTLMPGDDHNVGFTIQYDNVTTFLLATKQESLTETDPFTGVTTINSGTLDTGGSIQGANPKPVTFKIKLTRNGGALDMVGSISGVDTGNSDAPFLETFSWTGEVPPSGTFTFNRLALFLGKQVQATSASLSDSSVTTNVPEPSSLVLATCMALGGVLLRKQNRHGALLARN